MAKKVLIVCTSADTLVDIPAGCWMEEVAAPYYVFKKHGFEVTIASIKGGEVPMDEASLNPPFLTKDAEQFILDDDAMKAVTETPAIDTIASGDDYDAIFLPGGHGTCVDFPDNPKLITLLEEAYAAGKVVAAVCHGPTGLVNVKTPEGKPIVAGKKVTGFSNDEEYAVAKEKLVPFLLETKLRELGGLYKAVDKWASHAIRDGRLVTGQNPGSSHETAELVAEAVTA